MLDHESHAIIPQRQYTVGHTVFHGYNHYQRARNYGKTLQSVGLCRDFRIIGFHDKTHLAPVYDDTVNEHISDFWNFINEQFPSP